uniref:Uncharacterized protein n=1 Tax=Gallus gallus TaxID=9031 RepID=A0A8V0XZP2_CHICK
MLVSDFPVREDRRKSPISFKPKFHPEFFFFRSGPNFLHFRFSVSPIQTWHTSNKTSGFKCFTGLSLSSSWNYTCTTVGIIQANEAYLPMWKQSALIQKITLSPWQKVAWKQ